MDKVLEKEWHVVCKGSELGDDKPLGTAIMGQRVVVWRCGDQVVAWEDICVHRGVMLSLGSVCDNLLRCAYHGWTYNGDGQCVEIPAHPDFKPPVAARAKTVYHAREHGGLIWVCLSDEPNDIPTLPEMDAPAFRTVNSGPFQVFSSAPRVIENFLDVTHFPFVHGDCLGTLERPEISKVNVEPNEKGFFVKDVRVYQPDPDGSGQGKDVSYDYCLLAPFTVYFIKHVDAGRLIILFNVRPVSETESIGYFCTLMDYDHDMADKEIDDFHSHILYQDKPIIEAQHPELLPRDLSAELHLRSDAMQIAYRKHIKQIGLTFGTS